MIDVDRPVLEGSVAVRGGRRLSFAEFGTRQGAAVIWMHGTPGARRQVPLEARRHAAEHDLRIIGVDRPGIGTSTPHVYENVLDWTGDLAALADHLGITTMRVVGLSGGGPYALAAGVGLPDRVHAVGVFGGVAPRIGPDGIGGGLTALVPFAAPVVSRTRVPLSYALAAGIRLVRPLAGLVIDSYAAVQPRGDRELLGRPEFRAMFLDDLLNGARFQVGGPLADLLLFNRHWGFELSDVDVPVMWWHGDCDHIIPQRHGMHCVERLPHATFVSLDGGAHLGGMDGTAEALRTLMDLGPRPAVEPRPATGI
ncbi:hydrolase, alpha/beta domain protein [Aeromicrobium marinum DSM 15272]|uniref:Hydrolase, alpha/beta domain protein n=1 Tax=Aeromicrobium marinum DSM 15272 TaxID=585531 RepID=E2S8H4_9ACTN|nr:alpha/beta hydrolase [Aeromicrobium marinum]EFQ84479.1 hydrolase, alpha/beta domain protein [Aeromicrobium marinum DSM 15272]